MESKRVGVIDLDSVIYSIMHPNKVLDTFGQPIKKEGLYQYFDKTELEIENSANQIMNEILTSSKSEYYIAYVKGKNTIKSRLAINPDYKQNRSKEQPKFWEFTKQYLIDNWNAIEVNDIEVDDACRITRKKVPGSFLICVDKDLLNLEGLSYNWRKKEFYNISEEDARVYFWKSVICGDKSDGIVGIKGKGIKYVEKLLEENLGVPIESLIFNEYIQEFGEYKGIQEFYKNYNSLYILEDYEGFVVPEPIKYRGYYKKESIELPE